MVTKARYTISDASGGRGWVSSAMKETLESSLDSIWKKGFEYDNQTNIWKRYVHIFCIISSPLPSFTPPSDTIVGKIRMETPWRRKCSQRTPCAESSLRPMAPPRMVSASLQQGTSSSLRATTTPLRYLSLLYPHFSLSSLFCSLCTIDSFLIPNTSCRVRTGAIALAKSEMCLCIQEQNQRNQIINLTKI